VRICSHYFAHDGFLEDGVLIREAGKLAGIPGVLIHGRNDLGGGACTPWELRPRMARRRSSSSSKTPAIPAAPPMTDEMHAAADRLYEQIANPA